MKNLLSKTILGLSFLVITSCSQMTATGRWENNVKDAKGTSVTTTLNIMETGENFTGTMTSTVEGTPDEKINASLKNIDFSGYTAGRILVITQLKDTNDPYFSKSTLTVSEEGDKITLSPSGLIFTKK